MGPAGFSKKLVTPPHTPGFSIIYSHLNVHQVGEISRFLQIVEAFHLHHLPDDFVGDLISPLVDDGHVDIVDEHAHFLPCRRSVRTAHPLVHVTLYGTLKHQSNIRETSIKHQ